MLLLALAGWAAMAQFGYLSINSNLDRLLLLLLPSHMLYPTDAFELIKTQPQISGGATPSSVAGGVFYPAVKMEYDVPESEWAKHGLPFIVWQPTQDRFDTNHPQKVELTGYRGQRVTLEPVLSMLAGHDVHLFVSRTSDLQCYRDMQQLLVRFLVATRYAMQTYANCAIQGGRMLSGPTDRTKYPNALHYVLGIVPRIPCVEEPNATVTGLESVIGVRSVDGSE